MNRWLGLGLLLAITAGALALRLPSLDRRPMHNDEAVNAVKFAALLEQGRYAYDPQEFHGPALHYAALPFAWLSGARDFDHLDETTLRLVTVAFGVGLILLLALLADGLGRPAALCAGAFTALSPAMVFYSRYFIHEMLLVFFTTLLLAAGWRYSRTRRVGWALLAGAGLGLMYATKETFIIAVAAMGAAVFLTVIWNRWRAVPGVTSAEMAPVSDVSRHAADTTVRAPNGPTPFHQTLPVHVLAALTVAAVVSITLFSSFFTNAHGPMDSLRTYVPWLQRAGGASLHIHPWNFYLERLVCFHPARSPAWSEGLIVALAIFGAVAALTGRGLGGISVPLARFLAFYTVILTAAYSSIPYKTPWCLLGFLQPMILLAGIGGVALFHLLRRRWLRLLAGLVLVAAAAQLGVQAYRASYPFAADPRNPYVYSQTSPNLLELVERVRAIAQVHPDGPRMGVKVISPEGYWPLPWYLRQLKRVGWWEQLPAPPQDLFAPVVIASARLGVALDDKSDKKWLMAGLYELRPGVALELYVEFDLWRQYVATLPRPKDE